MTSDPDMDKDPASDFDRSSGSVSGVNLTTHHVRRAREGDQDSLGWVFERFSPLLREQAVYRLGPVLAARIDPDDVVAEAWLISMQRLDGLVSREGRYTPVLLRFLSTTVRHVANGRMRGVFREAARGGDEEGGQVDDALMASITGALSRASANERSRAISAAIERLDEDSRTVVILRGIEGWSNTEAAEHLDELPNSVARRYQRALQQLRSILPGSIFDELSEA